MQFIKVADWQPCIAALAKRLTAELKGGNKVLWLVPGGSNVAAAVSTMESLDEALTEHLSILLTDERHGLPGHKDSNYRQLHEAGFNPKQAMFTSAIAEGLNLHETVNRYEELVANAFASADVAIGQFGIGADGHIAGILPHSPASTSSGLVAGYDAPPYTRVTLTFEALSQLSAAYAFVFGADKQPALHRLQTEELSMQEQPSQILRHLPEAYVYNDQLGEEL
ncbi:MAG TPA: 6-phosphogluconolactonase [Candidatus Saccharimonadales bacterium]|nr:6-phosphogluconolactonase [Candidatus Saccharimonadales bacterium]